MENTINYQASMTVGKVIKGTVAEKVPTSKEGIKTFWRLESAATKPLPGTDLVKAQVNQVDYGVLAPSLSIEQVTEALKARPEVTGEWLLDLIASQRQRMLSVTLREQPDTTFIGLDLGDIIEWATKETKRGRAASAMSGDDWKNCLPHMVAGFGGYVLAKTGNTVPDDVVAKVMAALKPILTGGAVLASEKQLETISGIVEHCENANAQAILARMLELKIELAAKMESEFI